MAKPIPTKPRVRVRINQITGGGGGGAWRKPIPTKPRVRVRMGGRKGAWQKSDYWVGEGMMTKPRVRVRIDQITDGGGMTTKPRVTVRMNQITGGGGGGHDDKTQSQELIRLLDGGA